MFRRSDPKGPNHRDAFFEEYRKRDRKRRISVIVSGLVSLLAIVGIFFYDDIARISSKFTNRASETSSPSEWTTESSDLPTSTNQIVEEETIPPLKPIQEDHSDPDLIANNSTPTTPTFADPIEHTPSREEPSVTEPEESITTPVTRGEEPNTSINVTQEDPPSFPVVDTGEKIYKMADEMPNYPGGLSARKRYVKRNINPSVASLVKNSDRTKVYLQFIVEPNGEISSVRVVQGVNNPQVDQEAIRLIEDMPRWEPGRVDGERVRVYYTIPIDFRQT